MLCLPPEAMMDFLAVYPIFGALFDPPDLITEIQSDGSFQIICLRYSDVKHDNTIHNM